MEKERQKKKRKQGKRKKKKKEEKKITKEEQIIKHSPIFILSLLSIYYTMATMIFVTAAIMHAVFKFAYDYQNHKPM